MTRRPSAFSRSPFTPNDLIGSRIDRNSSGRAPAFRYDPTTTITHARDACGHHQRRTPVLTCLRIAVVAAACVMLSQIALAEVAVIHVEGMPRQQMTYGMDFERLWHFRDAGVDVDLDELAQWAVGKCRVDYVRIAINPAAELVEGDIKWEVYDRQLEIMRAIQKVRPDIKWFASPRPVHNELKNAPFTPFPLWISVWQNPMRENADEERKFLRLEAEKGAGYYVRYLRFMQEQGFKMTYLDAINEATAHLRAADVARMMDHVREQMGDQMPIVIAPSAHNWNAAVKWINEAKEAGRTDFWQITACHNTRAWGTIDEFVAVARTLDRPIWNTELHGFQGPDDKAVANTHILMQHIRAGYSGINDWLSLGNETKEHKMFRNIAGRLEVMRVYYIFQQLVNTSAGGHYLDTKTSDKLTSTMAFRHDSQGLVTVWALNDTDETVDAVIQIQGYFVEPTEVRWWGPDNGREGSTLTENLTGDSSLRHTIAPRSLYCFTFRQIN
jgi:hypothetical protein